MKCKVFGGSISQAQAAYNEWAKDRALAKDVIVHSHTIIIQGEGAKYTGLMIVVFFDEKMHPDW